MPVPAPARKCVDTQREHRRGWRGGRAGSTCEGERWEVMSPAHGIVRRDEHDGLDFFRLPHCQRSPAAGKTVDRGSRAFGRSPRDGGAGVGRGGHIGCSRARACLWFRVCVLFVVGFFAVAKVGEKQEYWAATEGDGRLSLEPCLGGEGGQFGGGRGNMAKEGEPQLEPLIWERRGAAGSIALAVSALMRWVLGERAGLRCRRRV